MKTLLMYLAPVATAGAEAFVEYLANAGSIDKTTITRALMAAVVVDLTLVKAYASKAAVNAIAVPVEGASK